MFNGKRRERERIFFTLLAPWMLSWRKELHLVDSRQDENLVNWKNTEETGRKEKEVDWSDWRRRKQAKGGGEKERCPLFLDEKKSRNLSHFES